MADGAEKEVTAPPHQATLGELKAAGWLSRSVNEELRANAAARISEGRPLMDGVLGYADTVFPDLERALLAGHDVIFLGSGARPRPG